MEYPVHDAQGAKIQLTGWERPPLQMQGDYEH
jgi:hypothetical protein